jgi:putative ABC transport system permease protein
MNVFRQIAALIHMSLATLRQRVGGTLVIVIGMAGVAGVVVSVLATSTGFIQSVERTSRIDRAVVTRQGCGLRGIECSKLTRAETLMILDAPGIKHDADGKAIASTDVLFGVPVLKKRDGLESTALVFGVTPDPAALRPEIVLKEGRMFRPGLREAVVGRAAQSQYRDLTVGQLVPMPHGAWEIVGAFDGGGSLYDAGLLGDVDTLMTVTDRSTVNIVTVRLENPDTLEILRRALAANPSVDVDVERETDYWYAGMKELNDLILAIAYGLGAIMAVGAIFGGLNSMYAAISSRFIEIATLRAIGFGSAALVVSVVAETFLLTAIGSLIGTALAWSIFSGLLYSGGILVFTLTVTPAHIIIALAWALAVGMIGGLFPALGAIRLPVAAALQVR